MIHEGYAPEGKYLWDSWFVDDPEGVHHMFHLQADRSLHPDARHDNASVGHAKSTDYIYWETLPDAIIPGEAGAWDDLAIWTGSVLFSPFDGKWHQFYTGRGKKDPRGQFIGHSISKDLINWQKLSETEPILRPGGPYNTFTGPLENDGFPAFRDPFVFIDEKSGLFEMLFSARTNAKGAYNACIGRANSTDMKKWTLQEPLLAPERHGEMEVAQPVINDKYYLFFSSGEKQCEPNWAEIAGAAHGMFCYYSDSLDGEYLPVNDSLIHKGAGVVLDNGREVYDYRVLEQIDDSDGFLAMGWLNYDSAGNFIGRLSPLVTLTMKAGTVLAKA